MGSTDSVSHRKPAQPTGTKRLSPADRNGPPPQKKRVRQTIQTDRETRRQASDHLLHCSPSTITSGGCRGLNINHQASGASMESQEVSLPCSSAARSRGRLFAGSAAGKCFSAKPTAERLKERCHTDGNRGCSTVPETLMGRYSLLPTMLHRDNSLLVNK